MGCWPNTDSFTLKTASREPSWASTKTRCPADTTCPISAFRAVIVPALLARSSVCAKTSCAVPSLAVAALSELCAVRNDSSARSYPTADLFWRQADVSVGPSWRSHWQILPQRRAPRNSAHQPRLFVLRIELCEDLDGSDVVANTTSRSRNPTVGRKTRSDSNCARISPVRVIVFAAWVSSMRCTSTFYRGNIALLRGNNPKATR